MFLHLSQKALSVNKIWILIICFVQIVIPFYVSKAQSPAFISYQAVIRDANGMLIQENDVAMQISILRSSATGSMSYKESHTPTTDINGLISIEIGNGTALEGTQFDTINWGSSSYFIKTETDPENGSNFSLSGTFQLLSVPYALHAKSFSGDMQNQKITNLSKPTESSDAASKQYVDAIMDIMSSNGMEFVDFWIGSRAVATNNSIHFRDTSNMNATSWQWDFGDGNTSTNEHPAHTYTTAGSFTVCLTASNGIISHTKTAENFIISHNITSGGGLTDIDGNTYPSVIIGTQEWMAQNLYVSHYPDGSDIPLDESWEISGNNDTDDAYCWMNNESTTNVSYGALYNYAAATNGTPHSGGPDQVQGVCPEGWHLPNASEWDILKNYLTYNNYNYNLVPYARKEAKSVADDSGWIDQYCDEGEVGFDQGSNNSTGFTGIPVGYRYTDKNFYNENKRSYWWTSTEGNATAARSRELHNNLPNINDGYHSKSVGMSVRCLKDE